MTLVNADTGEVVRPDALLPASADGDAFNDGDAA